MQRPASDRPAGSPEIPPMYTPSQLRALRIAVIVMGLILLLGFATVIGRIVYLLNAAPKPAAEASGAASETTLPAGAIALPKGAVIKHLALSGNRLAIHYETGSASGIRVIDLAQPTAGITLPIIEAPAP